MNSNKIQKQNYLIFITGGHATPAVACINELIERGHKNLIYIGQKKSILFDKNVSSEYRLITESLGLPFKSIIAGKLSLFFDFNSLIWLARMPIGFFHALYFHLRYRPKLVLTFGSHVGLPVVFWAKVFGTPVVAHEQTVTLGRANRYIQKMATKVCYSWSSTADNETYKSNPEKFIYTGNPIRKAIFDTKNDTYSFSNRSRKAIFITGGNQGAHTLNEYFFSKLKLISDTYNVIHQTGSNSVYNDFGKAEKLAEELNTNGVVYIPKPYVFVEQMAEAYSKSFVIISRAGANTVTELLALKKKAIYIPIPTASGNEQFLNADFVRQLGLAIVIDQNDLEKTDIMKILEEVQTLQIKEKDIEQISAKHKDAEKEIINIVVDLLK
jgi:UDP-N-acetylglucosamine--N-acetylmuramyl-(pentapeptide) pyrophosphoryl-undecaprenol N-acetylglucosamine transferase